jgi:hypothetical protein
MNDAEAQSSVAGQSFKSIFSWWYESSFLPGSAFSSSGRFFSSHAWNLKKVTSFFNSGPPLPPEFTQCVGSISVFHRS